MLKLKLKQLKKWLSKIPLPYSKYISQDKINHIFYGMVFYLILLIFMSPLSAMGSIYIIALCNEIWDNYNGGQVEFSDLVATIALPTIITLILNLN